MQKVNDKSTESARERPHLPRGTGDICRGFDATAIHGYLFTLADRNAESMENASNATYEPSNAIRTCTKCADDAVHSARIHSLQSVESVASN